MGYAVIAIKITINKGVFMNKIKTLILTVSMFLCVATGNMFAMQKDTSGFGEEECKEISEQVHQAWVMLEDDHKVKRGEASVKKRNQIAAQFLVDTGLLNGTEWGLERKNIEDAQGGGVPLYEMVGLDGDTLLLSAIYIGQQDIARNLIRQKANVNVKGRAAGGAAPLMLASVNGLVPLVFELLAGGAGVNVKDDEGKTALHYASFIGCELVVTTLINAKADVEEVNDGGNGSLMMLASGAGDIAVAKLLLEANASVNQKNKQDATPLMEAVLRGSKRFEMVCFLLENKAAVDVRIKGQGITPLLIAAQQGHVPTAELLLENGADLCQKDERGVIPVVNAFVQNHNEMFVFLYNAMLKAGKQNVLDQYFSEKSE